MKHRSTLLASAVLALGGLTASADTLVLNDGREMRGRLVSVTDGLVVFEAENGQRQRVDLNRVETIHIGDDQARRGDTRDRNDRDRGGSGYGDDRDRGGYGYDGDRGGYGYDRDTNHDRYGDQTVSVPADRQWTDTGIEVRAGDVLRFVPSGEVSWGPGRRDGPAGEANSPYNQNRPIPDRPGAALIGRVGDDAFYIGDGSATVRAPSSGRLYLGINDDYVQDNSGTFQVIVQRPR